MTDRIEKLVELTLFGQTYAKPIETEFDEGDLSLSRQDMESKRLCEFILNQQPVITPFSKMTGFFNCNSSVVGDAFRRMGHKNFEMLKREFYRKPINNLSTFEWQHATADYQKVLNIGLKGIINEIDNSLKVHTENNEIEFLNALKRVANTLIKWAHKCSKLVLEYSEKVENLKYKENLKNLSKALLNVPENKPNSFYEAVLTIYVCFSADPDSVGTLDRYLRPFYVNDIKSGVLTKDLAREYLQELFLMIQSATSITSKNFTRGGESHFCVGGYLPDKSDGFTDLSKLIIESLVELPTYIPQVTLRWTKKLSHEDFRYVLDLERKDPNKRIAFQNDEKRIKCFTEICGFPYEKAVGYTTVGCNEPAFLGAISGATSHINIARSIEKTLYKNTDKIIKAKDFEEFYQIYSKELYSDLDLALEYDNKFNRERAKDINYLSSIFFQGTIEKAKSLTQGAGDIVIASPSVQGMINVIDSLIIVKQFVFDEKIISMKELISVLESNWENSEDLRTIILKKGDFFGNDTERSNYVAKRLYADLYNHLKNKKNLFGYQFLIGDLIGYNEHHKWYGEKMLATPDGRRAGDPLKYGLSQSEGKDREGLTALLNSISNVDPNAIGCGSTVTNVLLDEMLIKDDLQFEKIVDLFETYFKMGGVHFQLNYLSRKELLKAKENPENYKSLRVRVSGFSDYFVKLNEALQDEIIDRTEHK